MTGPTSASLGQLAVHTKTIPIEECQRLRHVVWTRTRKGKPTSLGRLLLKGGMTTRELRHLLRRGAYLDAVRCDCCGTELRQEGLTERKEYPCPKCGAMLLAFAPFAKRQQREKRRKPPSGGHAQLPRPTPDPDPGPVPARPPTHRLEPPRWDQTIHYAGVMPLPDTQPEGQIDLPTPHTDLDGQLDLPTPPPNSGEESTLPYGSEDSTIRFNEQLVMNAGDLPEEQTVHFKQVIEVPSLGDPRSDEEVIEAFEMLVSGEEPISDAFTLPMPDMSEQEGDARARLREQDLQDLAQFEASGLTIRQIGDFRLIRILGEGSVGQVFLARHPTSRQLVALKVLRPEAAADPEYLKRFQREARAAARVQHPNVVQVVGAGIDPDLDLNYLALEYVQGGSLQQLLDKTPILPERQALSLIRGVCLALSMAEKQGVVHRDIKPENILLTESGQPKLADLGLAKQYDDASQITETGVVVGTPVYIAPEQAMGEAEIDIRADIYSLGFCFWQMLTGRLPFAEDDAPPLEVIVRHLEQDLPDVRLYRQDISDGVAQIVRGMAQRERNERYSSPIHVVRDIDRVLGGNNPLGTSDVTEPSESAVQRGSQRLIQQHAELAHGQAVAQDPSLAPDRGSDEHPPAPTPALVIAGSASSPSAAIPVPAIVEAVEPPKKKSSCCCTFCGVVILLIGIGAAVVAGLVAAEVIPKPTQKDLDELRSKVGF